MVQNDSMTLNRSVQNVNPWAGYIFDQGVHNSPGDASCDPMTVAETRGRGRPRQFDEEQVLDALVELFWAKGYEDASLQESMGSICDRTLEKLAPTDRGIMLARRKMLKALDELRENGTPPEGVDPELHKVRSAAFLLPRDQVYAEAAREYLRVVPGKPHASV